MKKALAACAVLTTLALASPALAHEPVGSAEQVCVEGDIVLSGNFDNPGFETEVTATDSQSFDFGGTPVPAPATFSATFPGPERAAGTVTFAWTSDKHEGTLEAPYEAVEGCEKPPVVNPPPDQPPPPETPPEQPSPPDSPPADQPPAEQKPRDTLPFSGPPPTLPMFLIAAGLLGAGFALRRLRG